MKLFGLDIRRTKAITSVTATGQLTSVEGSRGWWPLIRESFAGAFQSNIEITVSNVTTHPAVFACTTLIGGDVSKMRLRLVQQDANDIWSEIENAAFSPVLRKPNHFQTRIQFIQSWLHSKLSFGNAYVLKVRDNRRVVTDLYVLDPTRVRVLIFPPTGEVFYEVKQEDLSKLPQEQYTIPASEIIHDRFNCLFHPLVGLSPIYACGLAAVQGLNIQNSSTEFFQNGSNPGGVITYPGVISKESAERVKAKWLSNTAGDVAILSDGGMYHQLKVSAADSQLIEQLRWTDEMVCACYHVPPHMVGFGPAPSYNNIEALTIGYFTQCLQVLIESIELCLDEGLGLTDGENFTNRLGTEFDVADLLRMDSATQMATLEKGKNYFTPNEGRLLLNLKPVTGGDTVFRQQQDFSLEALNKRDSQPDPFAKKPSVPAVSVTEVPRPQLPEAKGLLSDDAEAELSRLFHAAFEQEAKVIDAELVTSC